jgi:thiamine biosynthesis lipoprotein
VEDYREEIENLMEEYSKGVSKYDPQSEISDFNREGKVTFRSPYLREMFLKAREMYDISTGALDPTLMPSLGVWYCKAC